MSKKSQAKLVRHVSKSPNGWDSAICDAEDAIQEYEQRIARLKHAIRAFGALRDAGKPWLGGNEAVNARRLHQASE